MLATQLKYAKEMTRPQLQCCNWVRVACQPSMLMAATKNGIKSLICLPDSAPISKVEATKGYGAEVCLVEGVYDDAYNKAIELKEKEGYTFVHPFDDEDVIAGQGTIALEVLNDLDNIDAIVVPVGGGGLISLPAYLLAGLATILIRHRRFRRPRAGPSGC